MSKVVPTVTSEVRLTEAIDALPKNEISPDAVCKAGRLTFTNASLLMMSKSNPIDVSDVNVIEVRDELLFRYRFPPMVAKFGAESVVKLGADVTVNDPPIEVMDGRLIVVTAVAFAEKAPLIVSRTGALKVAREAHPAKLRKSDETRSVSVRPVNNVEPDMLIPAPADASAAI